MTQKKAIVAGLILSGSMSLALQPVWAQTTPGAGEVPGSRAPGQTVPEKIEPATPGAARQPGIEQPGAAAMSSEDIKKVQEALQAKGHNPGRVDGVMGAETEKALREFQQANNLPATGQIDKQTAEKLGVQIEAGAAGSPGLKGSERGSEPKGERGSGAGSERGSGAGAEGGDK